MRVDVAPFTDVKVRQAMRLIVDRQQMIDQTLSGYGSLGNDLYAPFDVAYASDLPQREQDIDQAKSLLSEAGQEGLQVELFTGDDIGSVRRRRPTCSSSRPRQAGVDVKVTKKTPFYDDDYLPTRSPRTSGTPATTSRRPSSARSRRSRAAPTTRRTGTTSSTATWSTPRPRSSTRPSGPTCSTSARRSSTTRAA
jgi:hypothetical protein